MFSPTPPRGRCWVPSESDKQIPDDRDDARVLLGTMPGRKSARSQGASACVAVAAVPGIPWVGIQDTRQEPGSRTALIFPLQAFAAFTTRVIAG